MYKFFPHTEDDLKAMLATVGVDSIDALYAQIPESIRFRGDYKLPSEMSEIEVREINALKKNNRDQSTPKNKVFTVLKY